MPVPRHPQHLARRPPRPRQMRPPSKGMAIASLVIGIVGIPTFGIFVVGGIVGLVLGIIALVRASKNPAVYGGKALAIGGIIANGLAIVLIPLIGMMAAIAIPSLLRARVSANEAAAIGDTRSVISAQMTYSSANGGYFDTLECLSKPYDCIPGYPTAAPVFLDAELTSVFVKQGYERTFYPGASADLTEDQASRLSPTSLVTFAYVTVPAQPNLTGVRAFCGDATGRICEFPSGEVPPVQGGMCPMDCADLQ